LTFLVLPCAARRAGVCSFYGSLRLRWTQRMLPRTCTRFTLCGAPHATLLLRFSGSTTSLPSRYGSFRRVQRAYCLVYRLTFFAAGGRRRLGRLPAGRTDAAQAFWAVSGISGGFSSSRVYAWRRCYRRQPASRLTSCFCAVARSCVPGWTGAATLAAGTAHTYACAPASPALFTGLPSISCWPPSSLPAPPRCAAARTRQVGRYRLPRAATCRCRRAYRAWRGRDYQHAPGAAGPTRTPRGAATRVGGLVGRRVSPVRAPGSSAPVFVAASCLLYFFGGRRLYRVDSAGFVSHAKLVWV